MKKRSKMPSRILAFLMAALMAVTSAPITAFAADSSETTIQGTSAIIDDPVSGTTGSGWDNIDGGSGTDVTPPEEGEEDNESSSIPGDGNENNNSSSKPEDGNESGNSSTPEGEDEDAGSSTPEDGNEEENENSSAPEENGSVDAGDLNGVDDTQPVVPPADGIINGTELSWATNFAAYAEATMGMPAPYIAGDAGGGKVTFTHYGWGVPGGGGAKH